MVENKILIYFHNQPNMEDNNKSDREHPKNQMEAMSDTKEAVSAYAAVHKLTEQEATALLILNELRCMHWHYDEWHQIFYKMAEKAGVIKTNEDKK
jgi:hypothetical protein